MLTRWGKRRYSDVRGCCGWSRWSSGWEPARVTRRAGRHGRRGKTLAPQWATKQCWRELPEANRQVAVRWLAVLASRVVATRMPEEDAADAGVWDLVGEGERP